VKGYASLGNVATYMGTTFTSDQEPIVVAAVGAAEAWIDAEIQHAWLEQGPITETFEMVRDRYIQVSKPPVATFDSIEAVLSPGGTALPLVVDLGYVVSDLRDGKLLLPVMNTIGLLYRLTVEYTPTTADVPDNVMLATIVLTASNLRTMPALMDGADPSIIQSYVVGGELEVTFRRNLQEGIVAPQQVLSYLAPWRKDHVVV
jgi:hypothetical protein